MIELMTQFILFLASGFAVGMFFQFLFEADDA